MSRTAERPVTDPATGLAGLVPPAVSVTYRLMTAGGTAGPEQAGDCVRTRVDAPSPAFAAEGAPGLEALLSAGERAQLARLVTPERRCEFVFSRYAVKSAVRTAVNLPVPYRDIDVTKGVFHQPILRFPGNPGLDVSLTHTGGTVMALVYPRACPMGIDLERVDAQTAAAARDQLTPEERALEASTPGNRGLLPLVMWTAREALSKALGTGFTVPLELLAVANLKTADGSWHITFRQFPHFLATAEVIGNLVLSVARPRQITMTAAGAPRATAAQGSMP
jgi:4'-phosphopantetheinyl transferase